MGRDLRERRDLHQLNGDNYADNYHHDRGRYDHDGHSLG